MGITERIFEQLELQGITSYKFAKDLGINRSNVSAWKQRNAIPNATLIVPICEYLGVSERYLLTGEDDEDRNKSDTLLLSLFNSMNDEGKEKALEQLEFFATKYKKHNLNEMVAE